MGGPGKEQQIIVMFFMQKKCYRGSRAMLLLLSYRLM